MIPREMILGDRRGQVQKWDRHKISRLPMSIRAPAIN